MVARAILLAASARAASAAPDLIQTFIGFDGTCANGTSPVRFFAATTTLDATATALEWAVSAPAPLQIERTLMCKWAQRPAVDRAAPAGRVWHVSGVCNNGTRVAVEWMLGARAGDAPTYVGACAIDAPFESTSTGYQQPAALPLLAYDRRVFAGGPYTVNASDGTVLGVTVPPDPSRAVQTLASLPPCASVVISHLPTGTDVAAGTLAAEDEDSMPLAPATIVILHPSHNGDLVAGIMGVSPNTGAQLWYDANVSMSDCEPSGSWVHKFGGWQAAELHRGVLIATGWGQAERSGPDFWMCRGDRLPAGGAVSLNPLRVRSVGAGNFFGQYASWMEAGAGDWPLHVAVTSSWETQSFTSDVSFCREAGVNATLVVTTVMGATAAPSVAAANWTLPFCPLPAPAACDHPATARGWLLDA